MYVYPELFKNVNSAAAQENGSPKPAAREAGTSFQALLDEKTREASSVSPTPPAISGSELLNKIEKMSLPYRLAASAPAMEVREEDWIKDKPEEYSMEKFREAIAEANYQRMMADPSFLPRWVTMPEPGISRSTDMVKPPEFREIAGGVMRIDYTRGGEVHTFIPSFAWRKTASTESGEVYNQQTPWGFRTYIARDKSSPPAGFTENGYTSDIKNLLAGNAESQDSLPRVKTPAPPAHLDWKERLRFYSHPAAALLK